MHVLSATWHCLWTISGCVLNLILIYVASCKSPKTIKSYATLIINFAVTDFVECLLDLFLQIRLIPTPGDVSVTYIMNGLCRFTGALSCKVGTSVFFHFIPHTMWSLLLSFAYRYHVLHNEAFSRKTILKILLVIYIPSLFQGLTFWTEFVETETILPLAKEKFPHYNFSQETGVITGSLDISRWVSAFGIGHICFPIPPVYTAILIFRRKIIAHLDKNANMMTKETKASHSQLLKALTFQACIPAFAGIALTCYVVLLIGLVSHPILEYAIFSSLVPMPSLSPLPYLLYVRPYRQFIINSLRRSGIMKAKVNTAKSSDFLSTGADQTHAKFEPTHN